MDYAPRLYIAVATRDPTSEAGQGAPDAGEARQAMEAVND